MNREGVLVSGADNGTLYFWDWRTGYNFQKLQAPVQPGKELIIYSYSCLLSLLIPLVSSALIHKCRDNYCHECHEACYGLVLAALGHFARIL